MKLTKDMFDTKELARRILAGLTDPVTNNEAWLRDVLDDAFRESTAYAKGLELECECLQDELACARADLEERLDRSGGW